MFVFLSVVFLSNRALRKFLPSWAEIEKHREVVSFTCGLLDDPRPLVDHVYKAFTQNQLEKIQDAYLIDVEPSLLESMYHETKVPLSGEPLHNKHLNYYKHPDDELMERLSNRFYKGKDTRPVHVPSRLHAFLNINDYIEVRVEEEEEKVSMKDDDRKPECAIFVNEPDTTVGKNLLSVCNEISQHQDVTDLRSASIKMSQMLYHEWSTMVVPCWRLVEFQCYILHHGEVITSARHAESIDGKGFREQLLETLEHSVYESEATEKSRHQQQEIPATSGTEVAHH